MKIKNIIVSSDEHFKLSYGNLNNKKATLNNRLLAL